MKFQPIFLRGEAQRNHAIETIKQLTADAKHPLEIVVREAKKSRIQEEKYHAQIGEIAAQWAFMGKKWDLDDMKRILVDAFAKYMRELGEPLAHDSRVIPSVDGERVVQLGVQTRQFKVKEASDFIEFLNMFAATHGVEFSEDTRLAAYDRMYGRAA